MNIGFIGQGFVGKNIADDFERRGHSVVRYALEAAYIGNKERIAECEVVFIAVPTPTTQESFDESIVVEAVSLVGEGKIAVIKSTLLPGVTQRIQDKFPQKVVLFSPEFLCETTAAYDAAHPMFNIVGLPYDSAGHRKAGEIVAKLLPQSDHNFIIPAKAAELFKYVHNIHGFMRVIFSNAMYDFGEKIGVDWSDVKSIMDADPMMSPYYNAPVHKGGRGAGGNCFVKDMAAFRGLFEAVCSEDSSGIAVFKAMEKKNLELLAQTGKSQDIVDAVYGTKSAIGDMRITYLASVRIPNEKASGLAIMRQCEAFARCGHEVTLLRPSRANTLGANAFSYYNIEPIFSTVSVYTPPLFLQLGVVGYALMRVPLFLSSCLYVWKHRNEIDVLYVRDQWMLLLPFLFMSRKKMVCEMHTMHTNWVTRFVCSRVGILIVISEGLRRHYARILSREDIILEPSGVDVQQFEGLPSVATVRTTFSLPQTSVIFGYLGKCTTMGQEKGVYDLIEGFSILHEKYRNTHLLIAGVEKDEKASVQNICTSVSLPKDAYTLMPLDPKLFAQLAHACDVLLMNYPNTPHFREYMSPAKLVAYLASGKRIVSSDLPSIRDLVSGTDAYLYAPENMQALSRAYVDVYHKHTSASPRKVSTAYKGYSWDARAARIISHILSRV